MLGNVFYLGIILPPRSTPLNSKGLQPFNVCALNVYHSSAKRHKALAYRQYYPLIIINSLKFHVLKFEARL